jgi:hypothetical protein
MKNVAGHMESTEKQKDDSEKSRKESTASNPVPQVGGEAKATHTTAV